MTNDFYVHDDGYPAFNAAGASAQMRAQFDKIMAGFDRLPALTGNGNKLIWVKADGTSLEVISSFTDVTTYNVSTSAHGLAPKLNNDAMSFLNGVGAWASIAGNTVRRSARTSNTILASADNAYLIDITSGTFSQTLTAAATLGSGWYCFIRNSGTGDITLDPNGAELIDGLASYIMYRNECRLVICDGSAFYTIILTPFDLEILTNKTITKPPGYTAFSGEGWSGGASGQRTNNTATLSVGGAPGGAFPFVFAATAVGATFNIVIGSGGAAVTGVTIGNSGTATTIAGLLTITGATATLGGGVISSVSSILDSGFGSIQSGSTSGISVWGGSSASNNASANGGSTIYAGSCGGSVDGSGNIRTPGTTAFGGVGGAASIAGNGTAGTVPGGGGGATQTGTQSGPGAAGKVNLRGVA